MKVSTTITVEIAGTKHELTQAEAKELMAALKAAIGGSPSAAAHSISDAEWFRRRMDRAAFVLQSSTPLTQSRPVWASDSPPQSFCSIFDL